MFEHLGEPLPRYVRGLRRRARRNHSYFDAKWPARFRTPLAGLFLVRYCIFLTAGGWRVDTRSIQRSARLTFPTARVVGDKVPRYIRRLDVFAADPRLMRVVIYRDVRDVVQSVLVRKQRDWSNRRWAKDLDVEAVSKQWVAAIEQMERNAGRCHIIRYEELVERPQEVFEGLGSYLGVDSAGFPGDMVRPTSVGKHRSALSGEELEAVMRTAGPTLRRLGYV